MSSPADSPRLPLIDLSLFDAGDPWRDHVAVQVDWAARHFGFFYVVGHDIEAGIVQDMLEELPASGDAVRDYTSALTGLGHRLMTSIGRGLGLGDTYFVDRFTGNPTTQFHASCPGAGEPSTQGLLTLLYQDEPGGLQVAHGDAWIDVPFVAGSFVIGVGELLERFTEGRYVSRRHRIVDCTNRSRTTVFTSGNVIRMPEVTWRPRAPFTTANAPSAAS